MKNSEKVKVPILAWYGDEEYELEFPESWDVTVCNMKGANAPPLSDSEIRKAFANPIGSKTIGELASGKKEVAILFDDLTKPTPTEIIVPYVLEQFAAAGIPDDNIRFIAAFGAYGCMDGIAFRKKLGDEINGRLRSSKTVGMGKYEGNIVREDMDEAARMVGLDVKIDAALNLRREIVALFVGDVVDEYAEGVKFARKHYATDMINDVESVLFQFIDYYAQPAQTIDIFSE